MRLLNKVIKASQYTSLSAEPEAQKIQPKAAAGEKVKSVLDQAFEKANKIVESAENYRASQMQECNRRADEELQDAKKQGHEAGFARGRKEGKEAGMRQGLAEGAQKAEAENRKTLHELDEMIQSVEKSKTEILSKFESGLQDLAVTIARAIVKKELAIDPKTLHSIIQNAVDSYRNQAWVRIYVSGKTADLLTKADLSIAQELQSVSDRVKVVVTPEFSEESCVIETPDQVIDAGLDTQLEKIKSALDQPDQSNPS